MLAMLTAIAAFVIGALGCALCVLVIRRRFRLDLLQPNNEVVAHYLTLVTALYGLFFGFVIVSLWEQQRSAEDNVVQEASSLRTVFRLADGLAEPARGQIRQATLDYAHEVTEVEWPRLVAGDGTLSYQHPAKDRIWQAIIDHTPENDREYTFLGALIEHFEGLSDARRKRSYDSLRGLPAYLWLILVLGSGLSIACTLFLGTVNLRTQALLSGVSGGLIALMLFVVHDLQHPFGGHWVVSPAPFELAAERIAHALHVTEAQP
ncbi:MAG TPA: hypothetical protein VNM90_17960 [Haliangium sp.]|nr:hypothetical protein [Haliangium sp.]